MPLPDNLKGYDPNHHWAQVARFYALQAGEPDPEVFARQIYQESQFNPKARSRAGAEGIAQFMPGTAKRYGLDARDPYQSLRAALQYRSDIRKYLTKNGIAPTEANILASYNAGEGNVRKYKGLPPFKETRTYVNRILNMRPDSYLPKAPAGAPQPLPWQYRPTSDTERYTTTPVEYNTTVELKPQVQQQAAPASFKEWATQQRNAFLGALYGGQVD